MATDTPASRAAESAKRLQAKQKAVAKARALKAQGVKFVSLEPATTNIVPPNYDPTDPFSSEWVNPFRTEPQPTVEAYGPDGSKLGYMALNKPNIHGDREISMIQVNPSEQRRGIATALMVEGKRLGLNPVHSRTRSPQGNSFASKTGDIVPEAKFAKTQQEIAKNKAQGAQKAKQIAVQRQRAALNQKLNKFRNAPTKLMGVGDFLSPLVLGGMAATGKYTPPELQRPINQMY